MESMKPTVYIETTVPSYLTAWPSRDVVRAGEQQVTRDWWSRRSAYELRVSSLVLLECGAGDAEAAASRPRIEELCRRSGYEPPVICTPKEFLGGEGEL